MPSLAPIAASTLGVTTVIPGHPNRTIVVQGFILSAGATAVGVNFQSHTTTALKTGVFSLGVNGAIVVPHISDVNAHVGWFQTASGEGLDVNLSAAAPVGGQMIYTTV